MYLGRNFSPLTPMLRHMLGLLLRVRLRGALARLLAAPLPEGLVARPHHPLDRLLAVLFRAVASKNSTASWISPRASLTRLWTMRCVVAALRWGSKTSVAGISSLMYRAFRLRLETFVAAKSPASGLSRF